MAKKKNAEYNASAIKSLSQHNHLLKRLSLTFGRETGSEDSPFSSQKTVAIREIIDNSIDEAKDGHGDYVKVIYHKDGSFEVKDTGRGLPVDVGYDSEGRPRSGVYLTMGEIQSGGKFTTDSKRFSSGLNGVGGSSTNHTSLRTDITVYRNKKEYHLSFKDGVPGFFASEDPLADFTELEDYTYLEEKPDSRPKAEQAKYPTGTTMRLWLRDSVFQSKYPVNTLDLTDRLRGTAFLIPGITIEVIDEVNVVEDSATGESKPRHDIFKVEGGTTELAEVNMTKPKVGDLIHVETSTSFVETGVAVLSGDKVENKDVKREVEIDVTFGWENAYEYKQESYVNTIRTRLGGVHETAFERALVTAFSERFQNMQGLMKKGDPKLTFDDFSEGLVSVLAVNVSEPVFTSQTKEELSGKEVQRAINKKLVEVLSEFANSPKNINLVRTIGSKVVAAARTRQAIHDQQELNRKKTKIESAGDLPEKLTDCEIIGDENSELYIVEGDSAKGSLKGARLSKYQALLPVRGKVISAMSSLKKVLANEEVQGIIKAIGAGSRDTFDINKIRYGRVFIATDADPDGGDIAALLVLLFWKFFRPLVEEGRLYMLVTPLFVFKTKENGKDKRYYANDESEKAQIINDLTERKVKYKIQRLKGLGEGGNDIMFETAMDPRTRTVEQVVVKDPARFEEMLELIFGNDTQMRKDWLAANPMDEFETID